MRAVADTCLDEHVEVDVLVGRVGGRDPAQRDAVVVEDGCCDRGETGCDLTVLGGVAALPGLAQHTAQGAEALRAATVAVDEGALVGVEGADLARGQRGHDRPAAGGEVRGKSYADIGDQRRPPGRPLLQHVEHVAAVWHGKVGRLTDAVDESGQGAVGDPLQRRLARVADAHLEGRHPQAVAAFLGDVGHEALLDHRVDEVVRRRPRQVQGAASRSRGTGSGWEARKRSTCRVLVAAGTWLMNRPSRDRPRKLGAPASETSLHRLD